MLSKAERTKQFIIEKTAPVFNVKGYAGTSINDLMVATGLTKGSIYGNFENKDDVALAAFDYNFGLVVSFLRSRMDERSSIIDKLLVYPETYRNFMRYPVLSNGCPVANTSTEADDTHPKLKEKAANAMLFWRESVRKQLNKGIETKELRPDINIEEVVAVLVGLIHGGMIQAKLTGKTDSLNASMSFLEKMISNLKY